MALAPRDVTPVGPAFSESFVKFDLEALLTRWKLLKRPSAAEGRTLDARWTSYVRGLRTLVAVGGSERVARVVLKPLGGLLGYAHYEKASLVRTREGDEDGGYLYRNDDGTALRLWAVNLDADLDAPSRRGHAWRYSPAMIAQRVLLARNERVGLLTDGSDLRVLYCDPTRPLSYLSVRLDRGDGWRAAKSVPDSFRWVQALCSPAGVARAKELLDEARLTQTRVTRKLREHAESAVVAFVNGLLEDPRNAHKVAAALEGGADTFAQTLWREALTVIYRLLFLLSLESSPDPARAFRFGATSTWRNALSPNFALGPYVRARLDRRVETGSMLGDGLRAVFKLFVDGLAWSEMPVRPLGGMLFGAGTTPVLEGLHWSEDAVAALLDPLLWTPGNRGVERQRVHYGSLQVEDLGRIYEGLLEREPGIATERMYRLRRKKLEVVLPARDSEHYPAEASAVDGTTPTAVDEDEEEGEDEGAKSRGTVVRVGEIPAGRFYLRLGLGRKATGSYYTPEAFVRYLAENTLGPLVRALSPDADPNPASILGLRVLDPAMGSGHFLVGACRELADRLYEACRLCDGLAAAARDLAAGATDDAKRAEHLATEQAWLDRVRALPDAGEVLLAYLPSRAAESHRAGVSMPEALALCRRLVAVHCLYGVDKNPLAVELAKLALWLEAHAEGFPLTFLDHRLICGDALMGPSLEDLKQFPVSAGSLDTLFQQDLTEGLKRQLSHAIGHVRALEESVGRDLAATERKQSAKRRLDEALAPWLTLARAWTGALMRNDRDGENAWLALARSMATAPNPGAVSMPAVDVDAPGGDAVPFEIMFPEVFFPTGNLDKRRGFDAVLGNPPWDALQPYAKEFFARYDLRVLDAPTRLERTEVEERLRSTPAVAAAHVAYVESVERQKRAIKRLYQKVNRTAGGGPSGAATDLWQPFAERDLRLVREHGVVGLVVPSAFHANESATGIRDLYLNEGALRCCFSFENRNKLFEIHLSFKFALVIAERSAGAARTTRCAFYLHDPSWLYDDPKPLHYSADFIRATGGKYLAFLELRSPRDVNVAEAMFLNSDRFGQCQEERGIHLGEEMHMTKSSRFFTATSDVLRLGDPRDPRVGALLRMEGYLPLHEGKTFHQYTDRWDERPRYVVALDKVVDKPDWRAAAEHYRLAFRDIAQATNERTGIFAVMPPGVFFGNKAPCERRPWHRTSADVLILLALANSYCFDYTLRFRVAVSVNFFILDASPVPQGIFDEPRGRFLAHAALRLTCNHAGYASLWREQLGAEWRESARQPFDWPALATEETRWQVRAAIDAVVAEAYGLDRAQYEHVLNVRDDGGIAQEYGGFSHKSYPAAPRRCLAAFDELAELGVEAFTCAHDPYADVALVHTLPTAVLKLVGTPTASVSTPPAKGKQMDLFGAGSAQKGPGRRTEG